MNLSYSLAKRGWAVLLVDADSQGGIGFSLTGKSKDAPGYYDFIAGTEEVGPDRLAETLIPTRLPGLSLLTRGSRRSLDRLLAGPEEGGVLAGRIQSLHEALPALGHDLVVYDTPSGIHPVTTGLARAVDALLVPQQPGPLCLRSLPQALRLVAAAREGNGEEDRPKLAGIVLSMADPEDPSNLDDQREFRDLLPLEMVLDTVVPAHRDFREACRLGVPVAMLRERPSACSLIFDQLAAELESRLGLYDDEPPLRNREDYARLVD